MHAPIQPRRGFKLIIARWRSQLIQYRVRKRRPITEHLQSISLKSRLSYQHLCRRLFQQIRQQMNL